MSLKLAVIALAVPPPALLWAALAGLLLGWRRLTAASVVGLFVLALPVTSDALLASLEQGLRLAPPADAPPAAVVILGGDMERGRRAPPEVGGLTLLRERTGVALARRTGLPILVSGGAIHPASPPLAALMAQSLQDDFGVAAAWQEDRSQDTWQNAEYSAAILREQGISSVYVVSQAWHLRRALVAFAQFGITATAAPTLRDRPPQLSVDNFVPRVSAWTDSYYALHEWIGWAWYRLRAHGG